MEEESATSQVNYTPPTVHPMDGTMWPETDPSAEFMDTCTPIGQSAILA